jgi:hypothetical protein
MSKYRETLLIGFTLLVITSAGLAQQISTPRAGVRGTWRLIGSTQANYTVDHDAIIVKGPHDNFRRLKFKVTDAGLNLLSMVVTYDNGTQDRIEVRQNIPQGGESRVIDLKGGSRSIRKIEFWYDTKGFLNGKADVTIFGKK